MPEFTSNDINDAKRRVEEMRRKAKDYIEVPPADEKKSETKENNLSFIDSLTNGLFSKSSSDDSFGVIIALILILSREGADNKLIFALLYILL